MEFPDTIIIFIALVFSSSIILILTLTRPKRRLNLPPGPPAWPIVGNLFQLAASGKPFFQFVKELLPKYGPIITLKMGSRTMIILSQSDLVHQALIQQGHVFATRPAENPTRVLFSCNKFSVNAAVYGPVWRLLRRNLVQNVLGASRLRDFRDVRATAVDRLVERLRSEAAAENGGGCGGVWVLKNVRFTVFDILVSICFGVEVDERMIVEIDEMLKEVLMTIHPRLDDFLPLLTPFFSKQRKRAMQVRQRQIATLVPLIERRRAAIKNHTATDFCYLDTLFDLTVDGRDNPPTNPELVTLCSEFLNGGADTTATTVEWAIARLVESPLIQSRLHNEIKSVVGTTGNKINEKDIENMPYLNAFVKELLRKHPPSYITLTHSVTEPAKLAGYDIPMGTHVEIYLPGISEDPKIWSDPGKFDPDRFIGGGETVDITGVTGMKMIPFGAGRRICPGLGMGTVVVSLLIARLVQEFEWRSWPENSRVDFSEKLEFMVVMKKSLRAMITPRV